MEKDLSTWKKDELEVYLSHHHIKITVQAAAVNSSDYMYILWCVLLWTLLYMTEEYRTRGLI